MSLLFAVLVVARILEYFFRKNEKRLISIPVFVREVLVLFCGDKTLVFACLFAELFLLLVLGFSTVYSV